KKGLFFTEGGGLSGLCSGNNSLQMPDGSVLTGDGDTSLATLCAEPLSQSAQHFINIQNAYQASTKAVGAASNSGYVGNTLFVQGAYGAPYRTPYSEQ